MTWHTCGICDISNVVISSEEASTSTQKFVNYHEPSSSRQFRITIKKTCQQNQDNYDRDDLVPETPETVRDSAVTTVDFFVDLTELVMTCPYFEKFEALNFLEFSTNCNDTWISAPCDVATTRDDCDHKYASAISAMKFHAFLDSTCPSLYGIRPAPITIESVLPVLDMLSHFHSEPLLTNCEQFLMSTNIAQLDGSQLIRLLDKGLCVSLDHRILGRILCVCLLNTAAKMSDVTQELMGKVGSVFAQAFVANTAKSFRHVKPLENESALWPDAIRHLMMPNAYGSSAALDEAASSSEEKKKSKNKRNHKKSECDHAEESFECILCFDQRCGKCKGEAAFCYKAMDNFLYEVRLQLYPHTYRPHLDRDLQREDRFSDYILRFQPLPEL